jgi:[ribosomal protein S18]-alanine N-acetyltransferase
VNEITLRPLSWWDIPAVMRIEEEAFPDTAWSPEMYWSELAGVPDSRWYTVAVSNDEVVGYVGLMSLGAQGDVQTIAVDRASRVSGVGGRLLDGLLKEAQRRGCTEVLLEVAADNADAQSLYVGRGFAALARRTGYYGAGLDAVVMRRRIGAA